MAETNVYKILAQGQMAATLGDIAAPGAGKCWLIGAVNVVNTHASTTRTYMMKVNGTGAANQVSGSAESLGAQERDEWTFPVPLSLGGTAGDTLKAIASAATELTYTIWGDEVTIT
jgi:hypothetical protein